MKKLLGKFTVVRTDYIDGNPYEDESDYDVYQTSKFKIYIVADDRADDEFHVNEMPKDVAKWLQALCESNFPNAEWKITKR